MSDLGRWGVVDPMAEIYEGFSPYNYTLNNPIKFIDPNGMWVEGANGYSTDDPYEIEALLNEYRTQNENHIKVLDGNCCDNEKNGQSQKATTIGIGIGTTLEGIGLGGVSRVIPIAGVAYSGWTIGDAIGSNIEIVSETVVGWLMELVVPAAVLSNQDKQFSPGKLENLKMLDLPPTS